MKSNYLVCYDISDPKRLSKVFRLLKGIGVHLQYSVFFCSFTWPQLKDIKERLNDIIHPGQDDIRIYPLPSDCKVDVLGKGSRVPEGVELYMESRSVGMERGSSWKE